jgi:hypothetical protein
MKKTILSIFLLMGIFFSHSVSWGADWKLLNFTDSSYFFYDAEDITHPSKDIVRVWEKVVYTERGIEEVIAELGEDYENLKETKTLIEINCKERNFRYLSVVHYAEDKTVIRTRDIGSKWQLIIPESIVEFQYKEFCR